MDFITKELQSAVATLKGIVPKTTPYPALKGIKIEGGTMTVTDLIQSVSLNVSTAFDADADEAFIIPQEAFAVISKLPASTVSVTKDGNAVKINSGTMSVAFPSFNADEFPTTDAFSDEAMSFEINPKAFTKDIQDVLYAASLDANKGVLQGVRITGDADSMKFMALDGFRLAQAGAIDNPSMQINAVVPRAFADAMNSLSKYSDGDKAVLSVAANSVCVKTDEYSVTSQMLAGAYPNIEQMIDAAKQGEKTLMLAVDDIKQAVELFTASDTEGRGTAVLSWDEDTILSIRAAGGAKAFSYELPYEDAHGFTEPFKIGFSAKYMSEAIKPFTDKENVFIRLNTPVTPMLLQREPVEPSDRVALVLPVRLKG